MLEVVEQQEHVVVAYRRRECVLRPQCLSGGGLDECGIGKRSERPPPPPPLVAVCRRRARLQGKARLAAAPGPRQRHEPHLGPPQKLGDSFDLLPTAEKRR